MQTATCFFKCSCIWHDFACHADIWSAKFTVFFLVIFAKLIKQATHMHNHILNGYCIRKLFSSHITSNIISGLVVANQALLLRQGTN